MNRTLLRSPQIAVRQQTSPASNPFPWGRPDPAIVLLAILVVLYATVFSARSIAAYATVQTLFDLATFEQGFWRALQGTLFNYSLESPWPGGEISRFGRHFSPLFILFLPLYALLPDPVTLLIVQSIALGVGAIPLYLIARDRLQATWPAFFFGLAYLLSPMLHDVNLVNEFHEIAFSTPLLLMAWLALERRRWGWYGCWIFLVLTVKEDLALPVLTLGLYLALVRRAWMPGFLTLASGLAWLFLAVYVVMPALRAQGGAVPFAGYEYLGTDPVSIVRGALARPQDLWAVITEPAKLNYVFWILAPLAILPLLGFEILAISTPSLLVILASTYPWTYAIFERYVAPVIPLAFIAAVVGLERVRWLFQRVADYWPAGKPSANAVVWAFPVLVLGLTLWSQVALNKYPRGISFTPDPHAAVALRLIRQIPSEASVAAADHRWLAHLAHRQYLYFLSEISPATDYILFDTKVPPITNVPPDVLVKRQQEIATDPDYRLVAEADGLQLYGRRDLPAEARIPEPASGDYVKGESPAVYLIANGHRRLVPNVETLLCHGLVVIRRISNEQLGSWPEGPPVRTEEWCQ